MSTNAMTAQIEGTFDVNVVASHFGDEVEGEFRTSSIELFPQTEEIVLSGCTDGESFSVQMAPRAALELAKKLMAMCADYTNDVGACDPCGELFPTEELSDVDTCHGQATLCTICMESGR